MSFEWYDMWIKGIRVKSLAHLMLLMARYCDGDKAFPFIDFYHRFNKGDKTVLDTMQDVVKLFVDKEGMTKRTAYDYAKTIYNIQRLTR